MGWGAVKKGCPGRALRSQHAGNTAMRSRLSQAKGAGQPLMGGGGEGERSSFPFAESLFPLPSASPSQLPLHIPKSLHLSEPTRPSRGRARVCTSSVVLPETIRIVSKLTHTTNVREPCHTALGSASCCLRYRRRRRRHRSRAGAPGSA